MAFCDIAFKQSVVMRITKITLRRRDNLKYNQQTDFIPESEVQGDMGNYLSPYNSPKMRKENLWERNNQLSFADLREALINSINLSKIERETPIR